MSEQRLIVNSPTVVGEIIDGEAIIMCLTNGHYYSSDGVGAVLWSWVQEGKSEAEIKELALSRYEAPHEEIERGVQAFLDHLKQEDLVRYTPSELERPAANDAVASSREAFKSPSLNCYTDMKDLVMLDPIHDVDDSGWPTPKLG